MLGDGGGLWLIIKERQDGSLSRRWVFRFRRGGVYSEIPLGPYPDISLSDARDAASKLRARLASGGDPATDRKAALAKKKAEATVIAVASLPPFTFNMAVREYLNGNKNKWRNPVSARQWLACLRNHALPLIGDKAINSIDHEDAIAILDDLHRRSPITAAKLRTSLETVFGYAQVRHRAVVTASNPFVGKNNLSLLYKKPKSDGHFKAIAFRDLPGLFTRLITMNDSPPALAARLQIALALRPGEARSLRFEWIEETNRTITIPVTKNGKSFVVPTNDAAQAVIDRCREIRLGDFLFCNRAASPVEAGGIHRTVFKLTGGASAHAVARASFSTWASETQEWASEHLIESCLNHVPPQVVRAYRRSDALELRRKLLAAWSGFLTGTEVTNIVLFRATAAE
jgi:integrase